jgi:2-oxoglutarate/2-oxoacid ferredoxin oxidoreductase subunit alpha
MSTKHLQKIVNDFVITFSTINGSGSATANNILLRALFKMGIPVSGKNIFPSNIQGLPTWYSIRVSKQGYTARLAMDDIVVAMNPTTIAREMKYILPNGVLFYADHIQLPECRPDITKYPMPVQTIVKEAAMPAELRDYIANMVYVGVISQILGISLDDIRGALEFHFKGKQKPINSNLVIIDKAVKWAEQNLKKTDQYSVASMNKTCNYIMSDGNVAGALGSLFGGLQFTAWYPITPASSLTESIIEWAPILRKDPKTGKSNVVVVQSEDELAAIGMVIGAGWAGLRSMTSTSGPGLSLMTEYLGLAYYSEVPVVVWDVQRVGPSTGLPTRTAQGDVTSTYFMSHGDTQFVMIFPGSVNECFQFGWQALDIAERLQTPVMVMIDLDLGMNQWMTKKFEYPTTPIDRGKILWEDDLQKMLDKREGDWGRFLDIDGDGIPYRTVPGNQHPKSAYFNRGTGHNEYAKYSEEPEVWERMMKRIAKKFETAKKYIPKAVISRMKDAKYGIIAYGSTDPAIEEARDMLKKRGILTDYLRLRSVPFGMEVEKFISEHKKCFVVEMNRDGQMAQLISMTYPAQAGRLIKACHLDGLPLTAQWISDQITGKGK